VTLRIAAFTPGPPLQSGGAVYAGALLPALARRAEVVAVSPVPLEWDGPTITPDEVRPRDHDVLVHFVGNNPDHLFAYHSALRFGGVVACHDLGLRHLLGGLAPDDELADLTDQLGSERALATRARWARGVATEREAFLQLLVNRPLRRARAVVVHSRFAAFVVSSELPWVPVYRVPSHTGALAAGEVMAMLSGNLDEVAPHAINALTSQFLVPLQNQLFIAAFAAGLFAHRTVATVSPCLDVNNVPRTCFLTEVGLLDLGPQLQMLVNPGESYPAEILGHPFGIEQVSCPGRAAPAVPEWHATAAHKLQMGLGDDMIGYIIPSPGWFSDPAVYADPSCPLGTRAQSDPTADYDQHGQYHKLESESVGPDGGNLVAQHLAALADTADPHTKRIAAGRFLLRSGGFTRKGADAPVGIWVLPAGVTTFAPGTGTVVALDGINSFGSVPVNAHGVFMDFDGRAQAAPDLDTRGMLVTAGDGTVTRYFTDVYPALTGAAPGAASGATATLPPQGAGAGLPVPGATASLPTTGRGPTPAWVAAMFAALLLLAFARAVRPRSLQGNLHTLQPRGLGQPRVPGQEGRGVPEGQRQGQVEGVKTA